MLETIIELILCVAIGFGFREQVKLADEDLTNADKVTDVLTYFLFVFICMFLLAVTKFTIFDAHKLHKASIKSKKLRYSTFLSETKMMVSALKLHINSKSESIMKSALSSRRQPMRLNEILKRDARQDKMNLEIQNSTYGFFFVLYESLRLHKSGAFLYHFLYVVRRVLLISIIFAAKDHGWLQFLLFISTCLLTAAYMFHSLPFDRKLSNRIELFNEFLQLWIGALFFSLLGLVHYPEQISFLGGQILLAVLFMILSNSIILFYRGLFGIRLSIRSLYRKRRCRKLSSQSKVENKSKWAKWRANVDTSR